MGSRERSEVGGGVVAGVVAAFDKHRGLGEVDAQMAPVLSHEAEPGSDGAFAGPQRRLRGGLRVTHPARPCQMKNEMQAARLHARSRES